MSTMQDLHEDLYKQIPAFDCIKGCTDCCGPIPFSKWEWDRVQDKRKGTSISCPYSLKGYCEIYEQRPLICRLYGTADHENLICPHGCAPVKKLSIAKAHKIKAAYIKLIFGRHDAGVNVQRGLK